MNDITKYPELIFGLVGPIGCNIDEVQSSLESALKDVEYSSHVVVVTKLLKELFVIKGEPVPSLNTLEEKIEAGNLVRKVYKQNGILAAAAINEIRRIRDSLSGVKGTESADSDKQPAAQVPLAKTAYIIRQLKRPEEWDLLQDTYGDHFIQVSITQDKEERLERLTQRTRRQQPELSPSKREELARKLIRMDENEESDDPSVKITAGQKLASIFQNGDVFIDGSSNEAIARTCRRFISALFGRTNIAPTMKEFGSYMAKAASLRSVDLSRQVGAALLTEQGDIITVGCNEVPKPLGGNYWDDDNPKHRDVDEEYESNREETNRIIYDFLRVLSQLGRIPRNKENLPSAIIADPTFVEAVEESLVREITEYGRMVHAEMNALSDAARLGRTVKDAILYVTTFPCHNCAKHIIASGIKKVIFIEPYPKSRAELMYGYAISDRPADSHLVQFEHFTGISPRRYRTIFEKVRRRDKKTGKIDKYYRGEMMPRIGQVQTGYLTIERLVFLHNFHDSENVQSSNLEGAPAPEHSTSSEADQTTTL